MSFERDIILTKQLLAFLEVAKCGQIKQTASNIHMKQSNLSNLIKELEDGLDIKLFNRDGHGVSLTRSGLAVFHIACDVYRSIEQIQSFSKQNNLVAGDLNLWISEGISSAYIPACLERFQEKFPNVHLNIVSSLKDPSALSEFDLGIVYHEPQFEDAFILHKGILHFNLYASKVYLAQNGFPKDLQDLKAEHKICLRNDFENRWPQCADLFQNSKNILIRTDSSMVLLNLVKSNLGISFLPSCAADDSLVPLLEKEVFIDQPYWIICPYHLKDIPKVRALMENIKETIGKL